MDDSDTIDINLTEQAIVSLTSDQQHGYQPKTLQHHNRGRYAYLPLFPTKHVSLHGDLLLANVPGSYFNIQLR